VSGSTKRRSNILGLAVLALFAVLGAATLGVLQNTLPHTPSADDLVYEPSPGVYYSLHDPQAQAAATSAIQSYAGPSARCLDGTYSYSQTHSGTCSYHGGVLLWIDARSRFIVRAPAPTYSWMGDAVRGSHQTMAWIVLSFLWLFVFALAYSAITRLRLRQSSDQSP